MRTAAAIVAAAALLLAAPFAGAQTWAGFYTPRHPDPPAPDAPASRPINASNACVSAIVAAQQRYNIPGNLLFAIGLQEAGLRRTRGGYTVWPWSVNAAGDGRMFRTAAAAIKWVRGQQAAGISSIDVGCMQVNLRWHPDAFGSLAQAFDPVANVDYAARFLRQLHQRTGDWMKAAGAYHSTNAAERQTYLAALQQNLVVANAEAKALPPAGSAPILAAAPAPVPQPNIAWYAALSAGKNSHRLSIYSTQELRPVLPKFIKEF